MHQTLLGFAASVAASVALFQGGASTGSALEISTVDATLGLWNATCADVFNEYGGLDLRPLPHLLPLGKCRQSGLWEFAHLPSGSPPIRELSGELRIGEGSCLVLVLLPARLQGVPSGSTDERSADRESLSGLQTFSDGESAYLIAKTELTVGQWRRISSYLDGSRPAVYGPEECFPVRNIAPSQLMQALPLVSLSLPTVEQWEFAARGGASGAWWTGDRPESVIEVGREYLGAKRDFLNRAIAEGATFEDLRLLAEVDCGPRRVGESAPNPFGLFDVIGNLREVCSAPYNLRDPRRRRLVNSPAQAGTISVVVKGGSYAMDDPTYATVEHKGGVPANGGRPTIGVRPVYRLGSQ